VVAGQRDVDGLKKKQSRLRESFLDLANAFVIMRMKYLRHAGVQPPDEDAKPRKT
jgi:hypothetical protein